MGEGSGSVVALRRGLSILDCFSAGGHGDVELGVNEIARQIGVHKSTVSRLCATLEAAGYLRRGPNANNRFTLGQRVYQLAGMAPHEVDLRSTARPVLDELVATCRETASLTTIQNRDVVTIEVVDGLDAVRMHSQVGTRPHVHASAAAKAILAWLDEGDVAAMLATHPMTSLTPNTITDVEAFKAHLAQVRQQGFSTDMEELEIGLRCVGAPVRDHSGRVIAGISLSGPRHRMTPEVMNLLGRVLVQSANAISARLGAPPDRETHEVTAIA
ncbi:MAG TPA: IclR family transcriptional regulator [Actinomycetales bacterium]|nr:IclR family transcriptional regulator [Actinomycetales bacterium]